DEFCRKRRQSPSLVVAPTEFNRHVAALDVARRGETLKECRYAVGPLLRRTKGEITNHRHRRLLRPRRERPYRCARQSRYEGSPSHLSSPEAGVRSAYRALDEMGTGHYWPPLGCGAPDDADERLVPRH